MVAPVVAAAGRASAKASQAAAKGGARAGRAGAKTGARTAKAGARKAKTGARAAGKTGARARHAGARGAGRTGNAALRGKSARSTKEGGRKLAKGASKPTKQAGKAKNAAKDGSKSAEKGGKKAGDKAKSTGRAAKVAAKKAGGKADSDKKSPKGPAKMPRKVARAGADQVRGMAHDLARSGHDTASANAGRLGRSTRRLMGSDFSNRDPSGGGVDLDTAARMLTGKGGGAVLVMLRSMVRTVRRNVGRGLRLLTRLFLGPVMLLMALLLVIILVAAAAGITFEVMGEEETQRRNDIALLDCRPGGYGGDGDVTAPGEGALTARQVAAVADYGLRHAGVTNPNAEQLQLATAIARGESGWVPTRHNPVPPDDSYGLWQINMLGDLGPDRRQQFGLDNNEQLWSPKINAIAMAHISSGGDNWQPWTVYTRGTYRQWMTEVQPIAVEIAGMSAAEVDQIANDVDSTVPPDVPPIDNPPPDTGGPAGPCQDGLGDVGDASLPLDPAAYPFDENRYMYVKTHHDYPAADLPLPEGTPVYAVTGGEVTGLHSWGGRCDRNAGISCGNNDTCGTGVNITDPTGAEWVYCHGTRTHVSVGDQITAGTKIMDSGNTGHSTGPHLHVGVRVDGESRCPQYFFADVAEGNQPDVGSLPAAGCFHTNGNERVSDGL